MGPSWSMQTGNGIDEGYLLYSMKWTGISFNQLVDTILKTMQFLCVAPAENACHFGGLLLVFSGFA